MGHWPNRAIQFWILVKQRQNRGASALGRQCALAVSRLEATAVGEPKSVASGVVSPMSYFTKPFTQPLPLGEGIDDFGLNFNSLIQNLKSKI
ncbi:hypothetical protein [Nostoc sp.]